MTATRLARVLACSFVALLRRIGITPKIDALAVGRAQGEKFLLKAGDRIQASILDHPQLRFTLVNLDFEL
ncbi:MAG: hypothetical protein ACFE0I_06715 [Elainellaceae cyanobacterium]